VSSSPGTHIEGHRIEIVRFRDRTVECGCGAVVHSEDHVIDEIRHDMLAFAFARHRKEAYAKERLLADKTS
jgi:hypothetical protein